MKTDEIRWNDRYRNTRYPSTVNDVIKSYYHLANPGQALDIAAGNGRNALFLAENGFQIDAVDVSGVAIDLIQGQNPAINCFQVDLDSYIPKPEGYDLIININFLDRNLFPHIKKALKKDGILIFKTFLDSHLQSQNQQDIRKDHYLKSNELLLAFIGLQIVLYKEEDVVALNGQKRESASLVARKRNLTK
ncbi:MAG: methyltransferase domain-containing protein [Deltaproteobacteria bacterium]|jgi:tellurite methyltransferase|nr:methyltransferase domain-containing protein [Deltaproteobacteria bacterium]MBT4088748.1 methyltransferase domain-containing protein [Deltaproteobacteria bacterium]MBT4263122.1 methyltransferase domain-containing protein [Deltaproteobacteria bacterium]MBT4637342.1 methyltransferase domain-containing protein [Deltaproteobacteria bacterium]MBT6504822.1 methyltransferase domain-containing protein [Deltaproteobacteria bacterium]